ncbi:CTP pyrophosphohydrolase [Nonomuraea coxensis DSM 45129]|uniref:CTP pyrophosphohydrolase n=1 Tax=Nonomuraea coxensis DSM 45129 TaxID=1122611 RepID=A0ABX8U641_9ACTN|nr:NUDIX hydrolase [Nonomuraea coxensis]QYC43202.1 CTP pyrophosphohydrolase [Nonomuraea coxensis DSM 45129]
MTDPDTRPLYERDPAAYRAHLAEGNANQARKRVGVDALVRDRDGRILLVDPTYKPDWDLPGGMAEANEPPLDALRRELTEELCLDLPGGMALVCVDWVAPHGPWDDSVMMIFNAGTLTPDQTTALRVRDAELAAFEFCPPEEARKRLRPFVWARLAAAISAADAGTVAYLHNGHSVS